ncbi:transcription termination/antitermination factor NusG [bacterium]|nr:transcription termination/antitermination factor NusG [bacterium]
MKWYAVHTLSGHELKAKRILENEIEKRNIQDKIARVLVPMETVTEIRHGKKRNVEKKLFPSYMFVLMELTPETQRIVKEIPGVTNFVMTGGNPVPMDEKEIERVLAKVEGIRTERKIETPFKKGDIIKVIDGPFKDFVGTVDELFKERGKVRIMVSIFGRLTPVEVDIFQVQEEKT